VSRIPVTQRSLCYRSVAYSVRRRRPDLHRDYTIIEDEVLADQSRAKIRVRGGWW
jgi:hypothetical protein